MLTGAILQKKIETFFYVNDVMKTMTAYNDNEQSIKFCPLILVATQLHKPYSRPTYQVYHNHLLVSIEKHGL